MREAHPDWCDKADDPAAVALWGSKRPELLRVVCPKRRHRLAAVYDLPSGPALCTPYFSALQDHFELGSVVRGPDAEMHAHAELVPLSELDPALDQFGWCRCGIWAYRPAHIAAVMCGPAPRKGPRQLTALRTLNSRQRHGA